MSFLNSKEWRKFQESVGRKTFDLGEGFVVKIDMPFGKNYLYSNYHDAPKFVDEIKKIAKKENAIFFRFEPLITNYKLLITNYGFNKAVKALQPQKTLVLDLNKHHDDLLQDMHKKTSYNIRLSQKKNLELKHSRNVDIFWNLLKKTSDRSEFGIHAKEYYKKLIELKNVDLYLVKLHDNFAAAAITIIYENRMTYLHGASDYSLRKYMAPYFLHWELIKLAGRENLDEYDFWGIDDGRWPGVTRFKKGFGGEEVEYIGSWDLILQKFWYKLYKIKNKIG